MWAALGGVALLAALFTPLSSASAQAGSAAPTNLMAAPGNGQVTLSWTPGFDNDSTVVRWEYTQSTPATNVWIPVPGSSRHTTRHTVIGLTNGTAYGFQVRAVSGAGNGAASTASDNVTPSTVPAPPADVRVDVGNSQAVLSWTAAVANTAADGFSAISAYQYRQRTGSGDYGSWTLVIDSGPATATHTVTGLANRNSYQFQVRALNANGAGAPAETELATVGTTPGRPRSLSAVPGDELVVLSWTPSSDGGFPITSWQFRRTTDDGTFTETAPAWVTIPESGADTTSYTVVSLDNAEAYKFEVRAENARGPGAAAESEVADPGMAPGTPSELSGAASQNSITITWTPPLNEAGTAVNNGGSPILRYEYSVSAGGGDYGEWVAIASDALFQAPIPAPPTTPVVVSDINARTADVGHVVEDLAVGTPYRFRVRAVNAVSPSDHEGFHDDIPVYLGTRPPSPATFSARPSYSVSTGSARVSLSWTSGGDGDSPITRWQYRTHTTLAGLSDNTLSSWVDICNSLPTYTGPAPRCRTSTARLTLPRAPLTPGGTDGPDGTLAFTANSEHFFVIRAVNAHGDGFQSVIARAEFPLSVPTAPEDVYIGGATGTVSNNDIILNWRPSLTGGSPILRYEYAVRTGTGSWGDWTSAGTATNLRYTLPTETPAGTVHRFRVRAVNDEGAGASVQSPSIVPGAPGTPGAADLAIDDAPSLDAMPSRTQISLELTGTTGNTDENTEWEYSYRVGFGRYSDWTHSNTGVQFDPSGINPIDGLRNGVSHTFRIRAVNVGGLAGPELVSGATRPGVAPPAPFGVVAVAGDQEITLSWTSQGSGGRAIIRWQVCGGETPAPGTPLDCNADDDWADIRFSRATTSSHTIKTLLGTQTPLTNGTSYTFQVRARNSIGGGAPAQANPATPGRSAHAPSRAPMEGGDGQVTISVDPPREDNGSPVVGYEVRKRQGDGPYDAWEALGTTAAPPATPSAQDGAVVSGLINGVTYIFQVRAVNGFGPGAVLTSAPITPIGAPVVSSLSAHPGDAQAALTWTLASNGGRAITGWQYRQSESGGGYGPWTDIADSGPDTASYTVSGLDNGISYIFQVRAVNGFGPSVGITSAAITPAAIPPAPTVTTVPGNGQVDLSWTAGASGTPGEANYAAPTNGWQYRMKAGAGDYGAWADIADSSADTTNHTVTGLENGTAYTFEVRAVNAIGPGEAGRAGPVTPVAPVPPVPPATIPSAPAVTAVGGNGQITVSWAAGDDGGSSVTAWHYRIKVNIGDYGNWTEVSADAASVTLSDLGGGTGVLGYTFQVRAANGVGEGEIGTSNEASPIAAPPANGMFYSGVVTGPDFCSDMSLGGARLFAHDSDGDGVADVCSLPYTRREAIARQRAVEALAFEHPDAYRALVNAACAATPGDDDCGGDMLASPPAVPINEGGPFYSGIITGPSFCANRSLGGPTTYPHDDDKDGVADVCALPYTRREAIARQLAGDILAATHSVDFRRELASACRALTGAHFGDNPAHLATDACA